MRLSTKGKYGLKAMYELARHYGEGPTSVKTVAAEQGLSEHYLEQLIGPLRKAGLVQSVRGAQGGYLLGKDPSEITVGSIIRVLEGPIVPAECVNPGAAEVVHCGNPANCVAQGVLARMRDSVAKLLDSITLADLCREADLQALQGIMYYI